MASANSSIRPKLVTASLLSRTYVPSRAGHQTKRSVPNTRATSHVRLPRSSAHLRSAPGCRFQGPAEKWKSSLRLQEDWELAWALVAVAGEAGEADAVMCVLRAVGLGASVRRERHYRTRRRRTVKAAAGALVRWCDA